MRKPDYAKRLRTFVAEIAALQNPAFVQPDQWRLSTDVLNAVLIGYEIESFNDRKRLHDVGQQHGLIPLCPNDLIDLDTIDGAMTLVVTTPRGALLITPHREKR